MSGEPGGHLFLDFKPRPSQLPNLGKITDISLRGCCEWVTDDILGTVTSSGQIQTAHLFRCWRLTDRGIASFVKHNGSTLRTLELSGCSELTDGSLRAIGRFCNYLRELDLTRCVRISDVGVNHLLVSKLEVLLLYADAQLSKSSYEAIASMSRLRRLDLCGHENLDSLSLIAILESCGDTLEYLNLSWCVGLGDEVLEDVVRNRRLKNIEWLSLFGIKSFSTGSMQRLVDYVKTLPQLASLDIRGIPSAAALTERNCCDLRATIPNLVEWKLHH